MRFTSFAAAALVLAGCGRSVQVHRTASTAASRPSSCDLAYFYKTPGEPYDELGDLETHLTSPPTKGAIEALRPEACRLGADALIVTKNQVLNELGHTLVAGTAIKFRPLGAAPAAASPEPPTAAPPEPAAPAEPAKPPEPAAPAPPDPQR